MTAGTAVAEANTLLDSLGTVCTYVELHTGDPGAAGTANLSSVTTRINITWNAASGGTKTASNQPAWGNWTGTNNEVITHLAFWTAVTGGTFEHSEVLATPLTAQTGQPVTLTSQSLTYGPLAA